MFKKIKFSWDLVKVYSLDASGKYSEALELLDKYSDYIGLYSNNFSDYYILKGSIYYRLHNYIEAQNFLEKSLIILEKSKFKDNEKEYLRKYIYILLLDMSNKTGHSLLQKKYKQLYNTNSYDVNKVRKSFLRNFPIA